MVVMPKIRTCYVDKVAHLSHTGNICNGITTMEFVATVAIGVRVRIASGDLVGSGGGGAGAHDAGFRHIPWRGI